MGRGLPERLRRIVVGRCRWCSGPLPKGRTSYCGDEHAHLFKIANEPAYARAVVLLRDRGRCAACGVETLSEENRALILPAENLKGWPIRGYYQVKAWAFSTWEMDHTIEIARGGESVLENLASLCKPCHKAKTARFAAERAAERRSKGASAREGLDVSSAPRHTPRARRS